MNITTDLVYGLLISDQYDVPKEAVILNAMQGPIRYLGLKEMAEEIQTQRSNRETAEKTVREQVAVLDAGARKYLRLESGAQVTAEQRKSFSDAVAATGDDAPRVILAMTPPAPAPEEETKAEPPSAQDAEFLALFTDAFASSGMADDKRMSWGSGAVATMAILRKKYDADTTTGKPGFVDWATEKLAGI